MTSCKRTKFSPSRYFLFLFLGMNSLAHAAANDYPVCKDEIPGFSKVRFSHNGDGTVTDKVTRLVWQRCDHGMSIQSDGTCFAPGGRKYFDWKQALNEVVTFNQEQSAINKPATWRLPNIKELASIVDMHCANYAIDLVIFPDPSTTYFSSTPIVRVDVQLPPNPLSPTIPFRQNGAWGISFLTGREVMMGMGETASIRLVK